MPHDVKMPPTTTDSAEPDHAPAFLSAMSAPHDPPPESIPGPLKAVEVLDPEFNDDFIVESDEMDIVPQIIISGYYGFDNLGDELILEVLLSQLSQYQCDITVLSQNPKQTTQRYGVDAVHRLNVFKILDLMGQAQLFISGGGGLFQDVTGAGSVAYYGGLIGMARMMQLPVMVWNQGVGPLKHWYSRALTGIAFKMTQGITVRDEESADLLGKLIKRRVPVTADPVWLLELPPPAIPLEDGGRWIIGISLRNWPSLTDVQLAYLARFFSRLTQGSAKNVHFLLLSFQPTDDNPVLNRFKRYLQRENFENFEVVENREIPMQIQRCHVLFGMRFHSLVLGLLAKIPVLGLAYDPKVWHLIHSLGLQGIDVGKFEELNIERVRDYFYNYLNPELDLFKQRAQDSIRAIEAFL